MSKRYTEILPKMDASQAIEVKDYTCPECGESAIDDIGSLKPKEKPALVGWCDTDWGLQMIVECPRCFTKYRFHGTAGLGNQKDIDKFEYALRCYLLGEYFSNSQEIMDKNKK